MKISDMTIDQQKAVCHNDGNIIVSASAGSGKTLVMISRIVRLIKEGRAKVKEILAMTFTDAAASEMKEKLADELIKEYAITEDKRIGDEINDVAVADISTVHSFCSRLIRNYFFEAGVSPDFTIAEEAQVLALKQTAIALVIKQRYLENDSLVKRVLSRHAKKRSDRFIKEKIIKIYEFFGEEAYPGKELEKSLFYCTEDGYNLAVSEYKAIIDRSVSVIKDNLSQIKEDSLHFGFSEQTDKFIDELLNRCNDILGAKDVFTLNDYAVKITLPKNRKIDEKEKQIRTSLSVFRDRLFDICVRVSKHATSDELERKKLPSLYEHTECLIKLVKDFGATYKALKAEENVLDFSDLQHLAIKILRDDEIRKEVKSRYKFVLIDEYQDTNATQEEIINLISDNNLFMVGDEKQSIYGFRGCRPEFFEQKFKKMQESETAVTLNKNFRSSNEVINAVNAIFDYCITPEVYGADYKSNSRLSPGGIYPEEMAGRVKIHHYNQEKEKDNKEKPRIYRVLEERAIDEEDSTGAIVAKIINEELGKKYYDFKEQIEKKVDFGDIAILSRRKKEEYLNPIIKALRKRGIPVFSALEENIADYPEVSSLICALELVDCIKNDIALATVMKSPIGDFSDEELVRISFFYRDEVADYKDFYSALKFYQEKGESPLKEKIDGFLKYFERVRFIADFCSAHEVLLNLVKENNIEARLAVTRGGKNKIARVRRLLNVADTGEKKASVKEFLRRLEDDKNINFGSCGAEEDSVKILTVHASKGLEYPVVIVIDADSSFNAQDDREEIYLERKYGVVCKAYNDVEKTSSQTLIRGLVKERFLSNRIKEETRLFYVALTRAKYSLHVIYSGNAERQQIFNSASSFAHFLPPDMPETAVVDADLAFYSRASEPLKVIIGENNEELVNKIKEKLSYVYPHTLDTILPLKSNVTKSIKDDEEQKIITLFDEENLERDRINRELAILKGNVAHKFMELYDFSNQDFYGQAEGFINDQKISKENMAIIDLEKIKKVVFSEKFSQIKDKELYREQPFLANMPASMITGVDSQENVLIQGVIDLLVVDGNEAQIIDYKYSKSSVENLKQRYQKQLELYAYAVQNVLGKKVSKKTIISLYSGDMIEID